MAWFDSFGPMMRGFEKNEDRQAKKSAAAIEAQLRQAQIQQLMQSIQEGNYDFQEKKDTAGLRRQMVEQDAALKKLGVQRAGYELDTVLPSQVAENQAQREASLATAKRQELQAQLDAETNPYRIGKLKAEIDSIDALRRQRDAAGQLSRARIGEVGKPGAVDPVARMPLANQLALIDSRIAQLPPDSPERASLAARRTAISNTIAYINDPNGIKWENAGRRGAGGGGRGGKEPNFDREARYGKLLDIYMKELTPEQQKNPEQLGAVAKKAKETVDNEYRQFRIKTAESAGNYVLAEKIRTGMEEPVPEPIEKPSGSLGLWDVGKRAISGAIDVASIVEQAPIEVRLQGPAAALDYLFSIGAIDRATYVAASGAAGVTYPIGRAARKVSEGIDWLGSKKDDLVNYMLKKAK